MNIQDYIDEYNKDLDEDEGDELLWVQGGVSKKSIKTVEKKIGVSFPATYRDFLLKFGSIAKPGSVISGVNDDDPLELYGGTLYGDTLCMREDFKGQYEVPDYL